jgi:hypothetical protein
MSNIQGRLLKFMQRGSAWGLLGLIVGFGASACQSDTGGSCDPGSYGCGCVGGVLCTGGLTCISNLCLVGGETGEGDPTGDGDPTGEGDPQGEAACDHLLGCVKAAQPESLSTFAAIYGPGGSCFTTPGLSSDDCALECDAQREILAEIYPAFSECGPPNCGDGKLDRDEACDGVFANCTGTCTFGKGTYMHECNPVTQVGCSSGHCGLVVPSGSALWFGCQGGSGGSATVETGDPCVSNGDCKEASALCVERASCGGKCCLATCYLGPANEEFGCAAGTPCTPVTHISETPWPANSDVFGWCL